MIKFYPNDHVKDKDGRIGIIHGTDALDRISTSIATGIYFPAELTLIRRADEPEIPSQLPDPPTPPANCRWVYRGTNWSPGYSTTYCSCGKTWDEPRLGVPAGMAYHYLEAVSNDADYTPPQLSEPLKQPQVESKVKINRRTEFTNEDHKYVSCAVINGGKIVVHVTSFSITPTEALALAELLTAAANEVEGFQP